MNFECTDDQKAFQSLAAEFAQNHLAPHAAEWDKKAYFPIEVLREAAKLGFSGMTVSTEHGGVGISRLDAALIYEQLATGCVSTAAYLSIHNMVIWIIDTFADDQIRNAYLPSLLSMQHLASYCLTEPQAGSDAAALSTSAVRDGEHYVLNGSKSFISGGSVSDVYLCMVRTGPDKHKGISCLLVDKNTPGLSFGPLEKKMGWRSQPTSMVFFDNCRVPVQHRIGEEGQGFPIALQALEGGRINIGACSLGGALACLKITQEYVHNREQFGKPLANMPVLRYRFADLCTNLEAARLMVYRAASALDNKDPMASTYCAMAKRYASDVGFQISDQTLQMHGGYGYLQDYPIERIFRDLRVHQILEGTNEIMREIIAKQVLDKKLW
ncbi:MAG: acyl-CoA dehydrogenase family protein [Legionellaceae bacterium]|nr:acyl-CoA dehydrogenase family protein [Legionellaceae bacterium]